MSNTTRIRVTAERLSDESIAYNVEMVQGADTVRFACVSKRHAQAFAREMQANVLDYTVETPETTITPQEVR